MASPADILSEIDDHGFADTSSTRKMGVLNDTIADVCSREPWPFLEKEVLLAFDGLVAAPTNLPADFSKVLGMQDTIANQPVAFERWEIVRKRYGTNVTSLGVGGPIYYYFTAGRPRIYPVPSVTQTIQMEYVSYHPTVLQSDPEASILIPARHSRVLVLGALYKLYSMEDDPELSQVFEAEYEKRIGMMREDLIRVQYDSPDHIYVTDEDYYDDMPWLY
jgi:hypothetical protein